MKIHVIASFLLVLAVATNAEPNKFTDFLSKVLDVVRSAIKTTSLKVDNGERSFCGSYDCPSFKVENKTDDYELRCYPAAYWVSTTASGAPVPMGGQNSYMFSRLFSYIQGANNDGVDISMTVPVMNHVKGNAQVKKLKMSFYIPKEFQNAPPKPTNKAVFLEKMTFCAYVRIFKGYVRSYKEYVEELNTLKKALDKRGLQDTYVHGEMIYTGYDAPWKFWNRRNEVMLVQA